MPAPRAAALACAAALAGCVQAGDFGRPRPSILTTAAEKTGTVAAFVRGEPVSSFDFTDDETELRDRAWRFLMPAQERAFFGRILSELTRTRILPPSQHPSNRAAYFADLMAGSARSPASRYRRLAADAGADLKLIPGVAAVGERVIEADRVRLRSLAYVRDLGEAQIRNAAARVGENRCLLAWVRHEAVARADAYRYALEHLVIEAPQGEAVDAERVLSSLEAGLQRLADLPRPGTTALCPEHDGVGAQAAL